MTVATSSQEDATCWAQDQFEELGLRAPQRIAIPGSEQSVDALVKRAARLWPSRQALIGRDWRLTFADLDQAVDAAALLLAERGISPGTRVAASAANSADIVVAFLATMRRGAIWVGINRALALPERVTLLKESGACLYLCDAATADRLRERKSELPDLQDVCVLEPGSENDRFRGEVLTCIGRTPESVTIDPWAPAAIAFTSGTTGMPKGAVHSQHNMVVLPAAAAAHRRQGQWQPHLRRGVALPLTILNLMVLGPVTSLLNGATCVCMDRIDVAGLAEWIERERIETFAGAPTTIHDLLTRPEVAKFDLSSLVVPTAGGGHVSDDLKSLYRERFSIELGTGYGLTEALAGVAETHATSPAPPGSCGLAYEHIEIGIVDEAGHALSPGNVGEVRIRAIQHGPWRGVYQPALGYWRNPVATASLLRNGWLMTGDIGEMDDEGYLFIRDRRNDLIIRGGANVYPAEIERVLQMDRRIRACAVIGLPDERLGQKVAACIEPSEAGSDEELVAALKDSCAQNLARYKIPESWHVMTCLPRNAMNKVVKADLVRLLAS